MRVLLSADTVGGVWDYAATLARELDAAGDDVLLAVVGEVSDARRSTLPASIEVAARPYRLEWMADAAADVDAAGGWLRSLAAEWGADVAHLNQMAYAAAGFPCPVVTVVHSDVLSWFSEVEGRPASADFDAYARWVRSGLAASDVVVTPTAYQSALTARHFGRAADRVIPNGVVPPSAAGETYVKPAGDAFLLTAARAWDPAKGIGVLDDALDRLGGGAPDAHLLGETTAPHGETVDARRLTLHGRVEREGVDAWMERAAVYVGPSLYEPFGLAPLEAALRGCALVLSDIGSFRELWSGCAVFFAAGDADALAGAIDGLMRDPERRASLGAAARARALRRYTAARMAADYRAVHRQVAGGGASAELTPNELAAV